MNCPPIIGSAPITIYLPTATDSLECHMPSVINHKFPKINQQPKSSIDNTKDRPTTQLFTR